MEINFDENEVNIIRASVAQLHVLYIVEDVLTVDPIKKAKVFIQGYRVIQAACMSMSIKHKVTREKLVKIIKDLNNINIELSQLLNEYNRLHLGRDRILEKITILVNDEKVSSLIDFFIILIQRRAFLNPEAVKGFSLEGKSGELVKEYLEKPKQEEERFEDEEMPITKEEIETEELITSGETEKEEEKEELKEDIEEEVEEI